MQITYGSKVTMHFSITLSDGTVADSSYDEEPITFVMGEGALEGTLELALIGLRTGESQTLTLDPGQAFGQPDAAAIVGIPRKQFPDDMEVEPGTIIEFVRENGDEAPGTILHSDADKVSVDFNHPLSGHEIIFHVDILEIDASVDKEVKLS